MSCDEVADYRCPRIPTTMGLNDMPGSAFVAAQFRDFVVGRFAIVSTTCRLEHIAVASRATNDAMSEGGER